MDSWSLVLRGNWSGTVSLPLATLNNFTFELMFSKCSLRDQW